MVFCAFGFIIELFPLGQFGPTGWYYYDSIDKESKVLFIYCGCMKILQDLDIIKEEKEDANKGINRAIYILFMIIPVLIIIFSNIYVGLKIKKVYDNLRYLINDHHLNGIIKESVIIFF